MLTNEEKRIITYSGEGRPTRPIEVIATTPLEDLNLNWREQDLPERVRTKHVHRLHPYLGKYIPQLVEIFLRKYFSQGQTVLDPFAGSGTTIVQANELGINAVGYDISAFNVLLGRAKTAYYDTSLAKHEILDALTKVRTLTQKSSRQLDLWETTSFFASSQTDNQYLNEWFAPCALSELLAYRHILETENYQYRDLLKIILCRSARSARLTTHFDLDFPKRPQIQPYWCYKHSRDCQPTTTAFQFLNRYSVDTIRRISEYATIRTKADVTIHHADSRCADIPFIDGIITSPPYVGLIDYHEQHAYAYHLLGLQDQRVSEIGAAVCGSSQRAKRQYQEDIAKVFHRAAQSMPSGGRMVVVAGDKHDLYGEIAVLSGMEEEAVVQRHVNRRTGRRSTEFYESVFIWRKP